MKSLPTATGLNDPEIIDQIEHFIRPLNPPVFAFEKSIRNTPFKILISVLISSRTKDEVTGKAVKELFKIADTPEKMLSTGEKKIAQLIFPVGFYRQKAKQIIEISKTLRLPNQVPDRFQDLVSLPGVGRKTANLVLSLAFNHPAIAVDTHVFRISKRLGWAKGEKPETVEAELKKLFPEKYWNKVNQILVGFGQTVCRPIKPLCNNCFLNHTCPHFNKTQPLIK
jgi:endonuclease-3